MMFNLIFGLLIGSLIGVTLGAILMLALIEGKSSRDFNEAMKRGSKRQSER